MSKAIPAALQTHMEGEVLSLSTCIRITKNDGTELRMTNHDRPLTIAGDTFSPTVSFDSSAIKSASDLSTDNAEIILGLDGETVSRKDFESDLYRRAAIEIFIVNWENPSQGVSYLKRGTIGDFTIVDETSVKVQVRGLTQSLQRTFVELYSPTCRVAFGGDKCGFANIPTKIRKDRGQHRTADWFFVPFSATLAAVSNGSFEANGVVANSASGINGWTYTPGSFWKVQNAFAGVDGSYYLEGGDDGQGAATGQPVLLSQSLTTSSMGMLNGSVDTGNYAVSVKLNIANTGIDLKNKGRITVTLYDATGKALRAEKSPLSAYKYQAWTPVRTTMFLVPGTRRVEVRLEAYKFSGTNATIAFDDVQISWWDNVAATFNDTMFKVCRFPSYGPSERMPFTNASFDADGIVPNGTTGIAGWTSSGYWETKASEGALTPFDGGFFLRGGDNASAVQSTYTISQTKTINITSYVEGGTDPYIPTADIDAGRGLAQVFVRAARFHADASYAVSIDYLSSADVVLGTSTTGTVTTGALNTWIPVNVFGKMPATTRKLRATLTATSKPADSNAEIAFDALSMFAMNAAVEAPEDLETGTLAAATPSELSTLAVGEYTFDGSAIVQAKDIIFGVTSITLLYSAKEIEAAGISNTSEAMYSGRVVWLSGPNAGRVSFIRSWNDTTKRMVFYEPLTDTPLLGDKFMFAEGCNKTITDCATRFDNATNFRGEPYLPGTSKVIEFFSTASTTTTPAA